MNGGARLAVIFGCAGQHLEAAERKFFASADPAGFILFARNIDSPAQVRALTAELRECAGNADAPVLIDQEGGRVARLRPPHWRAAPPAARFGELARRDAGAGGRAVWLNTRLMAAELRELGISVDCLPLLDLPVAGAHDAIGDRAFADDVDIVATLGRAACEGMLAGGILPVIKHIPGHGRAMVDSHENPPLVSASRATLEAADFEPFRRLADMPVAMTGHMVFSDIDPDRATTVSRVVIGEVIRGHIGFAGLLLSDDLSMRALGGSLAERTEGSLAAGCDIALHCNGDMAEMEAVRDGARPLDAPGAARLRRALDARREPEDFDAAAGLAELDSLLGGGAG